MRTRNIAVLTACILACLGLGASALPNYVVIFIDDLGYGDIGPFGNTVYQTPSLDRMAAEGNVLRDFYASYVACTPSRSSLLTGCFANRIGMSGFVTRPSDPRGLNPDEITIAEMLGDVGYVSGCFGKWHLGDQPQFMPLAQGFDEYFGIPYSNDMWHQSSATNPQTGLPYTPLPVVRGSNVVAWVSDGVDQSLLCEAYTDEILAFIENHQAEPFFVYFPNSYVHGPRYARPEILEAAEGDILRAQVEEVDTSVGRILDKLVELNIATNTFVIFTSDNGPANGYSAGPLRGGKGGDEYEGNMRVPTITWWPNTIPAGVETSEIAETMDLLPSFAALSGATVPADRTIDGLNAVDVLLGVPGAVSPHTERYYKTTGIRQGDWKYLDINGGELYDLSTDIGEATNLVSSYPAIATNLQALLIAHNNSVASDTRPRDDEPSPVAILSDATGVLTLAEYLGYEPPVPPSFVLMDPDVNDGSFESVFTGSGTVRVDGNTTTNLGAVWIYANNGPNNNAGWFNNTEVIPYSDNDDYTNTVTSVDILGTSGYTAVTAGDEYSWSFDVFARSNASNTGTNSFGSLSLSFDGGATWNLLGTLVDGDQQNDFDTLSGIYTATVQNATDSFSHGLMVRGSFADVTDGAGNNANIRFDNVNLSVIPIALPAVLRITPGSGGAMSINGSNLNQVVSYTLQGSDNLSSNWYDIVTTSGVAEVEWMDIIVPSNNASFFRVIAP